MFSAPPAPPPSSSMSEEPRCLIYLPGLNSKQCAQLLPLPIPAGILPLALPSSRSLQMLFLKSRRYYLLVVHLKPQRRKLLGSRSFYSGRTGGEKMNAREQEFMGFK